MAQQQENPIYWAPHASKWNLTLIFGLVVAVLGFTNLFLLPLGLVMAAYSWLTTPRQYLLYRDRMVIVYGMPRTRVISFAEISHVETLALPFGERLRLRMVAGNRMMLMMRDPSAFRGHLEDALSRYHGEQTGDVYVEGSGAVLNPTYESGPETAGEPATGNYAAESETAPAYDDAPAAASETYTGRTQETSRTSGSYTESEDSPPAAPETPAAPSNDAPRSSGSFTEAPTPDYSGEGRPAYDADVDLETGRPNKPEERDRPPSPY